MYRVQVRPKDGDPVILTVSVYADSWTDAVKRAVRCLTDEMVAEDRDAIGRSEFRVIDPSTGHHYVVRSLADLQAQSMRNPSTPVPGEDLSAMSSIPQKARPAGDVLKTVNNPRGWRPQAVPQAAEMAPKIQSDRLRPTGKGIERTPGPKATRGQFARVVGWTSPSAEVSEIVSKAVDMTWEHIPCEAVQCFVPTEGSNCFSVAASRGEPGSVILGSRIQLPPDLTELANSEVEPVAFEAEDMRFIYEHKSGAIVSQQALAVLWVPVVAAGDLLAILVALNPRETSEFTDGDLNGAVYLAETLARRLHGAP